MPDEPNIVSVLEHKAAGLAYDNHVIASVNDHVVRVSTMTEPYPWHVHPDSDETFLGVEGCLIIELESGTVQLHTGELFTVKQGVVHRTRPQGSRSVNLTFEHGRASTEFVTAPKP